MKKIYISTLIILSVAINIACQQKSQAKEDVATAIGAKPGQYTEVSAVWTKQAIQSSQPEFTVLDVRTPEEVDKGKLPGAIMLDFKNPNFENELDKLDKSTPYLVYCRSGNRSLKTCNIMIDKGFNKIFHMNKGYNDWSKLK